MKERLLTKAALAFMLAAPIAALFAVGEDVVLGFLFFLSLVYVGLLDGWGLYFWWHWERRWDWGPNRKPPVVPGEPLISILVPCFNEQDNVRDTLHYALNQRYENIEVIAINDGSSDSTAKILNAMAAEHPKLRVVHLAENQGKAVGLRMGALAAHSEYLVCIDGDACLDPDAAAYLVQPLVQHPRVGAVTGNPRIRTRSTLVGKIQVGEFSSIIGLIKRTQRIYGQVFTVSGVVAAFRRRALDRVGYWSLDMITEDIDISWKLQRDHWSIFYEPRALCWILMPETLKGLWKQRLRWAQGGAEVFVKNVHDLWTWQHRRLWPMFAEYCLSTLWAYLFAASILLWIAGQFMPLPEAIRVHKLVPPGFTGLVLCAVCLMQFTVSAFIDRRYERNSLGNLFWIVWYPMVYWMINLATTLVSFTKVALMGQRPRARWISPDRGIHNQQTGRSE